MVKKLKIFQNVVFDSSNFAFWDTERNAKNHSPLQSTVLEKSRNTARNWPFIKTNAFLIILIFIQQGLFYFSVELGYYYIFFSACADNWTSSLKEDPLKKI